MRGTGPISTDIPQAYTTRTEFCKAFTENMASMHLLSFLLTADLTKAEECFVSGLEDCVEGTHVFRDWAQSWARRTIIQNAIHMLAPRKDRSAIAEAASDPIGLSFARTRQARYVIGSILCLEDFERFVFVMSVLEKYTDHDCSVLLGCSRREISETRMRALLHLAESSGQRPPDRVGFDAEDHEHTLTRDKTDGTTALSTRTGAKITVL